MKRPILALLAAGLLAAVLAAPSAAADPYTVVAGGLHNPRGLAFGPGGVLYVSQAGLGGGNEQDGAQPGFGLNGSITRIRHPGSDSPAIRTVKGGLPSLAVADPAIGLAVIGISGLSVHGHGNIMGIMGESQEGTGIDNRLMGALIKVTPAGRMRRLANVGSFNWAWSGDHADLSPRDFPDSNPYGVLAVGRREFVVDAGTNTLNVVTRSGRIKTLAFFPDNALADSTPTCVTRGPDGALYIGTLALTDSLTNGPSAQVYRVDLRQTDPNDLSTILNVATVWADGLWPIAGCAFGPDGTFYGSELVTGFGPQGPFGDVVAIPFAHPDQHTQLTGGALSWPAAVAVSRHGQVYVVNGSTSADGQVVRLP